MGGFKKGQLTIPNLIGVFIALILYFLLMHPILQPMIATTIAGLDPGNPFSPVEAAFMQITPFMILLAIVLTAINYAIPQREQGYYPGG